MKSLLLVVALALSTVGCKDEQPRPVPAAGTKLPQVTVAELEAMIAKRAATPVDANGPTTRSKIGIIPGAVLLTDYETYTASELPADKNQPLVFYCANEQCGASDTAAEKAIHAGHRDVRVLPAGILGWQQAGKQLQTL